MGRICTNCKEDKVIGEFNKNKSRKDGYNNICRVCSNARSKKYYQENKEHHKKVTLNRNKKTIKENQQKMFDYFNNHPCIDCGEIDPIVLEFDHRDDVNKFKGVGAMVCDGYSWTKVKEEIDKCDVRCLHCHRRRTVKQFGWYKGLI